MNLCPHVGGPENADCGCPLDFDCPHVTPCDTATECESRAEECACVEPHEDPNECVPWLREHDGEPKETDE